MEGTKPIGALKLYAALREIEQMPLLGLQVRADQPKPIVIWDVNDKRAFVTWSVDGLLSRDIPKAKQAGGSFSDLLSARREPPRPQLPQAEIDRAVEAFMTGDED